MTENATPTQTKALQAWTRSISTTPALMRGMWTDSMIVKLVQREEKYAGSPIAPTATIYAAIEQAFAGGTE